MKRDMDLIRAIAFHVEKSDGNLQSSEIDLDSYTTDQIGYHCALLAEAGLIVADAIYERDSQFPELLIQRLTWAGHEFVDAARNDTVWRKTQKAVGQVGTVAFEVFKQVLTQISVDTLKGIL